VAVATWDPKAITAGGSCAGREETRAARSSPASARSTNTARIPPKAIWFRADAASSTTWTFSPSAPAVPVILLVNIRSRLMRTPAGFGASGAVTIRRPERGEIQKSNDEGKTKLKRFVALAVL